MMPMSGSNVESIEGPYYSHLGVGATEAAIRQLIEQRSECANSHNDTSGNSTVLESCGSEISQWFSTAIGNLWD